jgi:hypothetical protein
MMVEGLIMKVLSTWKHAWNRIQDKLFHNFFLYKKVLGSRQQWNRENNGAVAVVKLTALPRVFLPNGVSCKETNEDKRCSSRRENPRSVVNFSAKCMDSNSSQASEKHWNRNNNGVITAAAWTPFSQVSYS